MNKKWTQQMNNSIDDITEQNQLIKHLKKYQTYLPIDICYIPDDPTLQQSLFHHVDNIRCIIDRSTAIEKSLPDWFYLKYGHLLKRRVTTTQKESFVVGEMLRLKRIQTDLVNKTMMGDGIFDFRDPIEIITQYIWNYLPKND